MPSTLSFLLAATATATGAAHARAHAVRDTADCAFTLTTGGDVSFPVGQYGSGQTRAGTGLTLATFTISNTTLVDSQGRGCWWTPPATVLQCDVGQVPEAGFEIGCDGALSFGGQSTFYECQTGTDDQVDIYLNPDQGTLCGEISLTASGCYASECSGESTTTTTTAGASSGTTATPVESYTVASPSASVPVTETDSEVLPSVSTIYSTVWRSISDCGVATETETATLVSCGAECTSATVQESTPVTATATATTAASLTTESTSGQTTATDTETLYTYTSVTPTSEIVTDTVSYTDSSATATAAATTTTAAQTTTIPSPDSVTIPESCPGNVTNAGEFNLPSLIIPVDSSAPDTASGTSYFGEVNSTISTIFNFDIPSADGGKTCNLIFLFPERDTLETSSFALSGSGAVEFSRLSGPAGPATTYADMPAVASDLGAFTVAPGNAYGVLSFACPAGEAVGVVMAVVAGGDTSLEFFQDYNPCPLGVFITTS